MKWLINGSTTKWATTRSTSRGWTKRSPNMRPCSTFRTSTAWPVRTAIARPSRTVGTGPIGWRSPSACLSPSTRTGATAPSSTAVGRCSSMHYGRKWVRIPLTRFSASTFKPTGGASPRQRVCVPWPSSTAAVIWVRCLGSGCMPSKAPFLPRPLADRRCKSINIMEAR